MSEKDPHELLAAMVGRGIAVATPIVLVLMIAAVWAFTGQDLGAAVRIGALPGVLFGAFAGGFIGMIRSVWNQH